MRKLIIILYLIAAISWIICFGFSIYHIVSGIPEPTVCYSMATLTASILCFGNMINIISNKEN